MKYNFKRSAHNKYFAFILAIAFIASVFSNGFVSHAASNTIIIDASKVKTQKSQYYTYDSEQNSLTCKVEDNIILNMDTDLELSCIEIRLYKETESNRTYSDFTIKGTHKLKVNGIFNVFANYYQESGTNVDIYNGFLYVSENATFKTDSNISAFQDGNCLICGAAPIFADKRLYTSGNLNVTTVCQNFGVFSEEGMEISGGKINVKTNYVLSLACNRGPISISGGEIYIEGEENVLYAQNGDITISGGYIEAKALGEKENITPIMVIKSKLNILDPMCIKEPANGSIYDYYIDDDKLLYNYIVDENGEMTNKVIIDMNDAAKKALAEEAAKKAAEEEAAKKATEEEAAKKAAEEAAKKAAEEAAKNTKKYSNEWVNGKWYNSEGVCKYDGILSWKCNSTGWWVEDTLGWYPVSQWLKIDGKWYYFTDKGYMDYSEYRDGCWLGSDGAWVEEYYGAQWKSDGNGWWFEDQSGWYPQSQWLWIDGNCYYFKADGYLATSCYIDGYWVNESGVCVN